MPRFYARALVFVVLQCAQSLPLFSAPEQIIGHIRFGLGLKAGGIQARAKHKSDIIPADRLLSAEQVRSLLLKEPTRHLFVSSNPRRTSKSNQANKPCDGKWMPKTYVGGVSCGVLGVVDLDVLRQGATWDKPWQLMKAVLDVWDGVFPGLVIVERACVRWNSSEGGSLHSVVISRLTKKWQSKEETCSDVSSSDADEQLATAFNIRKTLAGEHSIDDEVAAGLHAAVRVLDLDGGWAEFASLYPELIRPSPSWRSISNSQEQEQYMSLWLWQRLFPRLASHNRQIEPGLMIGPVFACDLLDDPIDSVVSVFDRKTDLQTVKESLKKKGATQEHTIKHLHFPIREFPDKIWSQPLEDAADAIAARVHHRRRGHAVIVQCSAGINRSVTAVMRFLHKYRGMSLADAWCAVLLSRCPAGPATPSAALLYRLAVEEDGGAALPWYYSCTGNEWAAGSGHASQYCTLGWDLPVLLHLRRRGRELNVGRLWPKSGGGGGGVKTAAMELEWGLENAERQDEWWP